MGYAIHALISKVPNFWRKSCVPFGFDILQSKLILISKIQNSGVKVVCQIPENLGKIWVIAIEKLKIPYCGINFLQKLEHRSRFQIMELDSSKSSNSKP